MSGMKDELFNITKIFDNEELLRIAIYGSIEDIQVKKNEIDF
jgi:hypothetical protein